MKPNTITDCRRMVNGERTGPLDPRRLSRFMRKVRGKRTRAEFDAALRRSFSQAMAKRYWDTVVQCIGEPKP